MTKSSPQITLPPVNRDIGVILFGIDCTMSTIILDRLISAGVDVRLLCLPGHSEFPLIKQPAGPTNNLPLIPAGTPGRSIASTAQAAGIDVWRIGTLHEPSVVEEITGVGADLVVVACYGSKIPLAIYHERQFGGLNVHPSILPDKRGPDPLFWVFRCGDKEVGVTVHQLSGRFDAGDILGVRKHAKPDGMRESELDRLLARSGGDILVDAIAQFIDGTVNPTPQDESNATWAPFPTGSDYWLTTDGSACHAYNFVCGLRERDQPIQIQTGSQTMTILDVHGWSQSRRVSTSGFPSRRLIEFADGWLDATVAPA